MTATLRSLRILQKNWKLAAIAILSLSVAMAIEVICLGISDTTLLIPPAGAEANRLVTIYEQATGKGLDHVSYPDFEYYRDNNHVFAGVAALAEEISVGRMTFGSPSQAQKPLVLVASNPVSENYFSVLGLKPFLGRLFDPGDKNPKSPIAVVTYSCWKRLGSDRDIVGKLIGGFSIIGVAPKEFTGSLFGINGDLLVPLSGNDVSPKREERHLYLLARMKTGESRGQARADLGVLSRRLAMAYPKEETGRTAIVVRASLLPPDAMGSAALMSAVLLAFALFVLLIACANVANLLLVIATGRRQEAAIKLALGVSRSRLMLDFLREGAVICIVSGALGYGLALAVVARYSNLNVNVPMVGIYSLGLKIHLDGMVVACTLVLMMSAILATGLPAAVYSSSPSLTQILGGEVVIGGTRKALRRNAITIAQVAICTLVLVGMGLCERSLYNLRHVDPGFSTRKIVVEAMFPQEEGYSEAQGRALYEKVRATVAEIPGVEAVSIANNVPLFASGSTPVRRSSADKPVGVGATTVDENYFNAFGIPVLAGRVFMSSDTTPGPDMVIISKKMAETFWPGKDAVGRGLLTGDPPHPAVVIGVVGDVQYDDLGSHPQPYLYYALGQHYQSGASVIARTNGDPHLWTARIADRVRRAGLNSLITPITFESIEDLSLLPQRVVAACATGLSGLGLLLAVVGLFGAISYSVSERKKEFGIRVALGARPWQLMKAVFRQTVVIAGAGAIVGTLLGATTTAVVRSQLYDIGAVEWSVLIPVLAAMLGISLAVAYFSARPWMRVDPMEAVRHV